MTSESEIREIADTYTARGWRVFPVDDQKRPRTAHGFKDASLDPEQFTDQDGIGIATGQVSGLVVVDLDEKNGVHGIEEFKKLMQGHPDITTRTVKTPTGGAHLYFNHTGVLKTRINHPAPGVDFKAEGGYVVAPPSSLQNGKYTVIKDVEPADLPDWLIEVFAEPDKNAPRKTPQTTSPIITAGGRNDALFKTAASLRSKKLTERAILAALRAENQERCNPPLPEEEIVRIAASAGKYPPGDNSPPTLHSTEEGEHLVLSGGFVPELVTQFQKIWCGDSHILLWIIHAFAAGFVTNNDEGLHLYIAGSSGLGKSESVKHALSLIPKDYVISGGFSRKGLLYLAEKMNPCTIVLMDDHCYDEDEAGIYRAMLAGWREPTNYYTVDRASKTVHLKERITQIVTSADGLAKVNSDGQNESRFCTIEIRRTEDQMKGIMDFIRAEQKPVTKEDSELILSAWASIINNPRPIEIPFSSDIKVDDSAVFKIREFKKFLCLIRASAMLNGRTIATQDDFNNASKMWTYLLLMLDNETAGLAKNERAVFEKITDLSKGGKRVFLSSLKNALPTMREPNIYRALRGKEGGFFNVSGGLLSKIRGMSIEKFYNKDSGESDQIITLTGSGQSVGLSPYSMK